MTTPAWFGWLKPRLFLSYAREDAPLADTAFHQPTKAGFEIYYDVEKTLVGECFHEVIKRELQKCDGLVAIVSRSSAASPWCQAELYYAHALEKPIAPLRLGIDDDNVPLTEPLKLLEQTIQYIPVKDENDCLRASGLLLGQFAAARQRRRSRILLRGAAAAGVPILLAFAWHEGIGRLNDMTRARERAAFLERIHDSKTNL